MKKTFIRKGIFACIAAIIGIASSFAQTAITTGAVTPTAVCAGGTIQVAYSTTGTVTAGTIFSVELSDAAGVFPATANVIGTGQDTPLSGIIPNGTVAGAGYKVRVVTAAPVVGSASSAFAVNTVPAAPVVTSPLNYTVGQTADLTATAITGATLNWYGTDATGGTASTTKPVPSTAAIGSTTYYVSQSVGTCESARAAIVVNVTCATPVPTIVSPVNYTVGATATALTATGTALKWYALETGGTALASAPIPSTTTAGTVSYYVSQTVSGCEGPRAKIDVVVAAAPCTTVAPTVTTPVNYIVDATATALTATGTALKWYTVATDGTALASAPTPSTTAIGTVSYYVSQTVGGCEGPRAKIDVVVAAAPCTTVAPTVTTPVNYTVGATATALTATGTALKWYTVATDGTALASAPTPSTTAIGTTSYYVSQTVGGCEGPRAKIDVVIAAAPCTTVAPTVTTPVNYIVGATASALTATGTALKWYTVATDGTALASAPTPLTTAIGTVSYYVSQTVGGCEGARAKIDVVVSAAPCTTVAPTITTPVNYTVGATATALTATGTALKWYTVATDGTALASAPTPSTTAIGTTSYYVSQTVGGCEGPRAKIDVVVSACATPAPTVTTPVNYTVGATASALTATGTALKWYTVATDGTALASAPTPSTTAIGTTSYYVSQTVGGCEGPRAKIDVVVAAAPCTTVAPTVATPVNYTVGATASALTATGTALKWYALETGGTALASAPIPSTTTAGTISYYVSQTVSGCEGPRAKIDVVVAACATPAPTVATPVNYTVGATATALTATGTALKWYTVATNATALASAPVPSTTTIGTTSYYVSQTLNGCEGPRAKIDVVVAACATPAPTVSNVNYCLNETPVALTATGTALKWYNVATGGTALTATPIPSTTTAGTTSYYVSQTVNGCEGPRGKIDVIVNPLTAAPTVVSPVTYLVGATNAVALTAAGTALKWYNVATGGTGSASAPVPSTTTAGTTSYYVSQTLNGCESARAKIDVVICATPAPTVTNVTYCLNETPVALTASGTSLKWYNAATGGAALTATPIPSTATAGTTSYYVSQTIAGCEGPRAKIDVIVNPLTAPPTVANITYCLNETSVALTATGTGLKWYNAATGGSALTATPIPSTTTAGTTSYYVSQTVNGCEGSRAKIDIIVNPQTPAPTVSALSPYCFNETAKALTATGTGLKWYTVLTGGTALPSSPVPLTTTAGTTSYYVSQTLNGCEGLRAKIDVIVKPQVPAPTVASAPIEYCQNVKAIPLTATVTAGSTLSWYGSNATGGTASGTAPTPSTENEGTTSYYVNQTDADGCLSPRAKIDVKINVTPKPTLNTSAVAYCQNEAATALSANGTNLKWYLTLDDTNPRTTALIPFTEKVSDYSFYVTQTGSNTCESAKAEIKIHIKPRPEATISGNSSVSPGQSTSITIDFSGDGPWTYVLSDGQTGTSNNAKTLITVTPAVTTNYVVTTVSNACGEGSTNGVAIVTVLIPTITAGIPSVAQQCAGKTFNIPFQKSGTFPVGNAFTAQLSTENDASKFKSIPSVVSGDALTATIPDTLVGGSYFIRVVSEGLNNVVPGSVSSVKLMVNPLPLATITGPSSIFMGASANLTINITGNAPWTFNLNDGAKDSLISTSVSPIIVKVTPKTTTIYKITSISNSCGVGRSAGSLRLQVDPVLGTEPPVVAADWLKIYPTMIDDKCTVEITTSVSSKEATVEIFDLAGRSLSKKPIRQKITEVDFTSKPSGMYLLKVQNGDRTSVQRIFKP